MSDQSVRAIDLGALGLGDSYERCDTAEASCLCTRERGHEGPHECGCGGSWYHDAEGFHCVAIPGSVGPWNIFDNVRLQG
jgi:hypothetical protein